MEENLRDIDQIDKFLNNELSANELTAFHRRLASDDEFRVALEKYQFIYDELPQLETEKLKQRLAGYHRAYEATSAKKPVKFRKIIYLVGSVAAVLCIGWLLVFSPNKRGQIPQFPESETDMVDIDSIHLKTDSLKKFEYASGEKDSLQPSRNTPVIVTVDPDKSEEKKDTLKQLPTPIDATQLALSEQKQLSPSNIKKINYPTSTAYTFDGKLLTLYADPSKGSLGWEVFKNDTSYLLTYGATQYPLTISTRIKTLRELSKPKRPFQSLFNTPLTGEPTDEKITLQFESHQDLGRIDTSLHVVIEEGRLRKASYFFAQKEGKLQLILALRNTSKDVAVYIIYEKNTPQYYLSVEEKIYRLDPTKTTKTTVAPINILTDKNARLFLKKQAVEKTVYQVKN